ncbi:MAG TPA: ferritin-like domain-containing protein [Methylomusa anaerophila]|uniref:Rubrerythrin n=1 Tax=Methylomusa anaerophila TaxID=1930071 RepID=A0A348AGS8_9FIRM|nr:ferritin-like domain-containing protein [Methylomusa anaerophila]BBB90276.1 rubrerythrin [Methylomusa anaerophila]HML89379.1 ferritin-like domain-containing protein [Methylomusa anaerophila]
MQYYGERKCCDPRKLKRSLCLILEALGDEVSDRAFYQCLIKIAPDCDQQEIIKSIRDDEIKHFKMFRRIYREITCEQPVPDQQEKFEEPESYCAGIQKAIFGELNAVEVYREIMFGLCTRRHRDMLFEIITDEIKHSVKWNFLYTKNCCECGCD